MRRGCTTRAYREISILRFKVLRCYTECMNTEPAPPAASPPEPDHVRASDDDISWQAREYIHHPKGTVWYAGLGILVLALLIFAIVSSAWTFAVLVIVMGIALGVTAARQPQVLHYTLTPSTLQIDNKTYSLTDFRAFGVNEESELYSLTLIPTRRFMPAIVVFFEEEQGEQIVDILGARLPMQRIEPDIVERLTQRLRC